MPCGPRSSRRPDPSASGHQGTPEQGKRALRSLLGDRRMTVAADAESQFRVEGLFDLELKIRDARNSRPERLDGLVAGTGFEPVTFGL